MMMARNAGTGGHPNQLRYHSVVRIAEQHLYLDIFEGGSSPGHEIRKHKADAVLVDRRQIGGPDFACDFINDSLTQLRARRLRRHRPSELVSSERECFHLRSAHLASLF